MLQRRLLQEITLEFTSWNEENNPGVPLGPGGSVRERPKALPTMLVTAKLQWIAPRGFFQESEVEVLLVELEPPVLHPPNYMASVADTWLPERPQLVCSIQERRILTAAFQLVRIPGDSFRLAGEPEVVYGADNAQIVRGWFDIKWLRVRNLTAQDYTDRYDLSSYVGQKNARTAVNFAYQVVYPWETGETIEDKVWDCTLTCGLDGFWYGYIPTWGIPAVSENVVNQITMMIPYGVKEFDSEWSLRMELPEAILSSSAEGPAVYFLSSFERANYLTQQYALCVTVTLFSLGTLLELIRICLFQKNESSRSGLRS